jgi:thiol-disulfide isomerase/thioredoxin
VTGVIVLLVALAVATTAGVAVRRRMGKIHTFFVRTDHPGSPVPSPPPASGPRALPALTAEDLGESLGEKATLVQFSTEFCAYCGPTRTLLGELARERAGVAVVEIDAAERMDLTRSMRVFSTPTVLVLGSDGTVTARSTGKPEKADLSQALLSVLDEGVRS